MRFGQEAVVRFQAVPEPAAASPARVAIPYWLRNRAGAAIILAVFFGFLGTLSLALEIGHPFGGYITYSNVGQEWADVIHETPDWWLARGDLRYGDMLRAINDLPYASNAWAEFTRAGAGARSVAVTVDGRAGGAPWSATVTAVPITLADVLDVKMPEITVAVTFLLLGIVVLRARPAAVTVQVFAALCACIALQRLTAVTSMATDARLLVNLPKLGHMIAAGLIGPLLFHLALVFPVPLPAQPRLALCVLYGLGLLAGLGLAATRFSFWAAVPVPLADAIDQATYRTILYLALGGVVALFVRLGWTWMRERQTRRQRRAAGILLVGLLCSIPMVIIVLGPVIPGFPAARSAFWNGLDLRYTLLATPIAFAYIIIRYQTFRSPSRLFIFVIILALSALLAAVGAWLWRLGHLPELAAMRPPFITMFTLVFAASLFWSSQASWRGWFGRFLQWEPRSYESARSFGGRVMDRTDLRDLPQTIAQALVDELELERAGVWLWQPERKQFALVGSAGEPLPVLPERLALALDEVPHRGQPVRVRAGESTPLWLRSLNSGGPIEVVVPLVAAETPIGLLGLGRRWDEEVYDERDLAVSELVGQQAALFLFAARQMEELRHMPERVAEAQERERFHLAQELHDTIQQFLGRLPFFLTVSRDLMQADPAQATAILNRCLADIEDAAIMLRGIQLNLAPNQLESSLTRPLQGLAAHVRQRSGLTVNFSATADLDVGTTVETRHALYRVIQQALDNVVNHAEATEVSVLVWREEGRVSFCVRDNGRGSTPEEREAAREDGRFGLRSMQTRLEVCGGRLDFTSVVGEGTMVTGWVPATVRS
ncbi:GAF domain-containing sensor histidine kinase [Promineifilum sp.]|uniref:sensor histidine kinase n=1 Tax=Promineifilum sp. TaxID=2664178 RepID=UPI0035B4D4AB